MTGNIFNRETECVLAFAFAIHAVLSGMKSFHRDCTRHYIQYRLVSMLQRHVVTLRRTEMRLAKCRFIENLRGHYCKSLPLFLTEIVRDQNLVSFGPLTMLGLEL